jgi:uncharacterized protein (TIGR03118 family)
VTIPPAGSAAPTGIVFNGTSGAFVVTDPGTGKSGTAAFIFSSEDGIISGWSPAANPTMALIGADASSRPVPAIYKGLAIATPAQTGDGSYLYATNFANGLVEQFDSNYNLIRSFTDANVAAGYAPFGAQTIDGHLFVTYALRSGEDDVAGPGNGYVDMFNFDGTFVRTLVGQGGQINSPWGLDIAPASFGQYAGDLLVGNFGDGTISIFDPDTGDFIGKLLGTDGNPLVIDGLWGLMNGNGGAGGLPGSLYFTAGIDDEAHGLFGAITPAAPEPGTWAMMLLGFGAVGIAIRRSRYSASLPQLA